MCPAARLLSAAVLAVVASSLGSGLPLAAAPGAGPRLPANGLGLTLPGDWLTAAEPALPQDWRSPSAEAPLYVRVSVPVEAMALPERATAAGALLRERALEAILVLEAPRAVGEGLPAVPDFDVEAWLRSLDRFLSAWPERPLRVEILGRPLERARPQLYAYLLKRASVVVRAVDPLAVVATGALSSVADVAALAELDVAPYVDAVTLDGAADWRLVLPAGRRLLPAQRFWVDGAGAGEEMYLHEAGRAFSRAVGLILPAPEAGVSGADLAAWRRILSPQAAVVPVDFVRIEAHGEGGAALPPDDVLELDAAEAGGRYAILFGAAAEGPVTLHVRGPRVGMAWLVDPRSGEEWPGGTAHWTGEGEGDLRGRVSQVTLQPTTVPALVRLGLFGGSPAATVEAEVRGQRGLSVEEIIARHQQFQARQDRGLRNLAADARIDYHFSLANFNETFDVTTLNRYLYDGASSLYEEREIYINGALWRGQKPPDLPFVLPEKVTEVPLDLRLDRRYLYMLEGEEELDGRRAYVVRFEPSAALGGAYRGRVWIDAAQFAKLRMEAVQLAVELPVISNKLQQTFSPVTVDGREWWLMTGLEGQMVFSALGRNVVLERELTYTGFEVNLDDYGSRREEALASGNQVLEETESGYRRLDKVRGPDGSWTTRERGPVGSGVSRLLVGGFSIDDEGSPSIPFAGVNYFNFNFRGTGTQLDVAWAGPLVNVFWSDPRLGGSKAILALEARVNPLRSRNKRLALVGDVDAEIRAERLEESDQTLLGILGYPLGTFHKVEAQADLDYFSFGRDDGTASDFVLPPDTLQSALTLRWVYNQAGWRLEWGVQGATRSGWRPWGKPDGSDFDPGDRRFVRSSFILNKTFYLREFDKLGLRFSFFDGNSLDRFSRFGLGDFGAASVHGYNGSGIRFDRGGVLDLGYSLNLGRQARLDLFASHGRFRNEEDFGPRLEHATGAGAAVNFSGPFNTFIRVRLSSGVDSSLEAPSGSADLRVTVFRTFDRWFWQKRQAGSGD